MMHNLVVEGVEQVILKAMLGMWPLRENGIV